MTKVLFQRISRSLEVTCILILIKRLGSSSSTKSAIVLVVDPMIRSVFRRQEVRALRSTTTTKGTSSRILDSASKGKEYTHTKHLHVALAGCREKERWDAVKEEESERRKVKIV